MSRALRREAILPLHSEQRVVLLSRQRPQNGGFSLAQPRFRRRPGLGQGGGEVSAVPRVCRTVAVLAGYVLGVGTGHAGRYVGVPMPLRVDQASFGAKCRPVHEDHW